MQIISFFGNIHQICHSHWNQLKRILWIKQHKTLPLIVHRPQILMTTWHIMPYTTNGLSSLIHFYLNSLHKNVQQRKIKGNYVALPNCMAKFSIKEHNEHQ